MIHYIKIMSTLIVVMLIPAFSAQAKLAVSYQQEAAVILKVDEKEVVSGHSVFIASSETVLQKAKRLIGQDVWVLYYEYAEKLYVADVKATTEPPYVIEPKVVSKQQEGGK